MTISNPHMPNSVRVANEPVFHYTSSDGLLGILKMKRLWASEASGMNDLAEVRSGWTRVEKWLEEQRKSSVVDYLLELARNPRKSPHEVFVLCGSLSADDANQWRLYASAGSGYAIELDPAVQLVAFSAQPSDEDAPKFGMRATDVAEVSPWLHVMYDDAEVMSALEEILDSVEAADQRIAAEPNETETDGEYREHLYEVLQEDAYEALATVAHLIKSPGFSGENEVRVVTTFFWGASNIQYRSGAYGVVGYADITAAPSGHQALRVLRPESDGSLPKLSLPVRSVRLGPLLHAGHEKTIQGLLNGCGFRKIPVTTSQVPLR